MAACATMASPSFQRKLRGPAQSGRRVSYFQRSSRGSTKGAPALRWNVDIRKATRESRPAGSAEMSSGIGPRPGLSAANAWRCGPGSCGEAYAGCAAIGFDHQTNQRFEAGFVVPAQVTFSLRGVANQEIHFRGTMEHLVGYDIPVIVQPGVGEGHFAKLAHGVGFAGGDHVVVRYLLLQHAPHGLDVIGRVAPVAPGIQIAQPDFGGFAGQDRGHSGCDFTGYELITTAGGFVIEQDSAHGIQAVGFAVIPGQVKPRYLADSVGRAGVEAGLFSLRNLLDFAEHFARSGEIETALGSCLLDRGKQVMRAIDIRVQGGKLVVERVADEALGRQMVTLVRLDTADDLVQTGKALEGAGMQNQPVAYVRNPAQPVTRIFQRP